MPDDFEKLNRALDRICGRRSVLVCEACGQPSDDAARGWRTYVTIDHRVATYCPECAHEGLEED